MVRGRQAEQAKGCCPPHFPSAATRVGGTANYGAEPDSRRIRPTQGQSQQQAWQTRGATSGGGHKSRTLFSAVDEKRWPPERRRPVLVQSPQLLTSHPNLEHLITSLPHVASQLFALPHPKVLPCPFFLPFLMQQIFLVSTLPDPELCPGDTVIWSDVTTLVKILKDISTSRQIAATLSALPFLSSPAAPSFAPPRPTPGPQDLPKIQPQQELPLSYWASLALTGW